MSRNERSYCEKCERCHEEGLREEQGEDCPYYGEPNGCNHPQYGFEKKGEVMETWRDIVAEMRNSAKFNRTQLNNLPDGFRVSGTIFGEAVVTRESVANRLEGWCDRIEAECKKLEAENAKLRRALEPVMDVIIGGSSLTDSYCAVRDAQAIMKG